MRRARAAIDAGRLQFCDPAAPHDAGREDDVVKKGRRVADRRLGPRFEVVGDLWGTLEVVRPLSVLDVGLGGALIESDRPWEVGAFHSLVIADGSEMGHVKARVRHVRAAGALRFLVGVEFVSVSPALAEEFSRWVALAGDLTRES